MPRRITEACVACGTCQANCPVGCISEGEIYTIDSSSCIDCGVCEAACPASAIEEE